MRSISQFFDHKNHFDHPAEMLWEPFLTKSDVACRIDWNPNELVRLEPRIELVNTTTGNPLTDSVEWYARLDLFLLRKGVRAQSPQNEALRCSLMLRDELEIVEDTFGDGFYNKALISYIYGSELIADKGIQEILSSLAPRLGGTFSDEKAKEDIDSAISEVARPLTEELRYPLEEASQVLTAGVRIYLDVRFSFSSRKLLGWT